MANSNRVWATAALAILCLVQAAAARSESSKLSRKDLHRLERSAHTADEYQELANYFRGRARGYRKQADEAMEEWTYRMQFFSSLYDKYPSPADSSRNRFEYFKYEEQQMDLKARRYEKLSAGAAQ